LSASLARALDRLCQPEAVLAPARRGGTFGVFAQGDRRRRPVAKLRSAEVRELESEGAIACALGAGAFVITEVGRARARRTAAEPSDAFAAQHRPIIARVSIDVDGAVRQVRGFEPNVVIARLGALRDGAGARWLSGAELAAATQLRAYWEAAQIGLMRGSDLEAPPKAFGGRGPGNAQEAALAFRCDGRRRLTDALHKLALPLRRVVERVCLYEDGLEALERAERWPARSGKIALKLGLAQLAASL
jgi:hypothetical protein